MAHPLLDVAAELGSESDDADYDEEQAPKGQGKPSRRSGAVDDSSEEEDEDDDEEAAAAVSVLRRPSSHCAIALTNRCTRFARVSSLTKMKRTKRNGAPADAKRRRGDGLSVKRKRPLWTRRTSISSERRSPGNRRHKYVPLQSYS